MTARNVLGTDLLPCSYDPLTGFCRDGCCQTYSQDKSTHSKALERVRLDQLQAHAAD